MRYKRRLTKQLIKLRDDYLLWNSREKKHNNKDVDQTVIGIFNLIDFINLNFRKKGNTNVRVRNLTIK